MSYTVYLSKNAEKELDKLPEHITIPIVIAINNLSKNPRPVGYIKLKGRNGYRIRVGNYRVLYEIIDQKLVVEIVSVGHRQDVYS